jgi:hypothetical protein
VLGFDSRDDILDVVAEDDLSAASLKDADELDFAVEVRKLTVPEAERIRATGLAAIDDITRRRWPFDESAWTPLGSMPADPPALPAGWDVP